MKVEAVCQDDEITAFGLTCSPDEPCEIFLELSGVETLGNRIFLTGNLHAATVTLWSLLLYSEDNGKTWLEPMERIRSTGLEQIQFIDMEYGWISGQQLLSLPKDPFVLLTNDGGKSWRRRPLSSEPRVGAVEQFSFESRTEGALLVDRTQSGDSGGRHELYETNTGGESWSLRQVSPKPLKLKRPKLPNADWRLRADGKTKSFNLEKRSGERWQVVSSFLIKAGECKPAETTLQEPPPTEEVKTEDPTAAGGVFRLPSSTPSKRKKP